MRARLGLLLALFALICPPAFAVPAKIIILRHGEKLNGFQLCSVGVARALALAGQYLGKGATDSLFAPGESPAAFHTITLHTIELVSPSAQSWSAPLVMWSAIPEGNSTVYGDTVTILNARTQQAAADILTNPLYDGKIVVLTWEHKHIANKKLEAAYPGQKITLRQLLNLDQLASPPPDTWKGDNYDYFWIVTYGNAGSPVPTDFTAMKQHFHGTHGEIPHNDWGKPETLPKNSGCKS
jgi:hypothetical protein